MCLIVIVCKSQNGYSLQYFSTLLKGYNKDSIIFYAFNAIFKASKMIQSNQLFNAIIQWFKKSIQCKYFNTGKKLLPEDTSPNWYFSKIYVQSFLFITLSTQLYFACIIVSCVYKEDIIKSM